jgi:hypothetical protein
MDDEKLGRTQGEEGKYGLNIDKIQLNLALILKGPIGELKRVVDQLEKENGIFVVYKNVSAKRFTIMEEQPY